MRERPDALLERDAVRGHRKKSTGGYVIPAYSSLLLFLAGAIVLLVIPGPAVFYIVGRTVGHGRPAGLVVPAPNGRRRLRRHLICRASFPMASPVCGRES